MDNLKHLIPSRALDPYLNSWTDALQNKKVLIIHPFKSSIERQYRIMDRLGLLPRLKSLEVIRVVQTIAGNRDHRFSTWFDALEYMKKEVEKKILIYA